MDVDLTIRYSDERLCEVVASRPETAAPLYRIVTRHTDLGASLTGTMREARPSMKSPVAGSKAAVMLEASSKIYAGGNMNCSRD